MEQRIKWLFREKINRRLTISEVEELEAFLRDDSYESLVDEIIYEMLTFEEYSKFDDDVLDAKVKAILDGKRGGLEERKEMPVRMLFPDKWRKYVVAAVLLVAVATWFLYRLSHLSGKEAVQQEAGVSIPDLPPGGNRAILTLADGSTILLDSAANGTLTQQGKANVVKLSGGLLAYETGKSTSKGKEGKIGYNTITTPMGGQYEIILPDGSKVWLNAASSVKFPTSFTTKTREVEITGEAYFEVVRDLAKPFHARVNGLTVEVLGTSFNINAYADEPVLRTTLVEGRVRVITVGSQAIIQPGEQAQIIQPGLAANKREISVFKDPHMEATLGWKNGLFVMASTDIGSAMRQISRWYNIEVVAEGDIQRGHITGQIPRNTSLPKVLTVLRGSGINFKMDSDRLILTH